MGSREPQATTSTKENVEEQLSALRIELQRKNRELEIEAALDKVRTRTSAMRSSSELAETSAILFQQLAELQIKAIRTGVGIFDEPNNAMELWVTSYSDNQEVMKVLDYFSLYAHPVFENIIPARQQKKPFVLTVLSGNEVKMYYQIMSTYLASPGQYNEREYYYSFFFAQGTINVVTGEALNDDECKILIRFAQVFGLIYTRFLDLQRAETQAREAEIETALERVRSTSMSMQHSEDLKTVIDVVKDQLIQLGFKFHAANFVTGYSEKGYTMWLASPNDPHARRIDVQASGENFFQPVADAVAAGADFAVYTLDFDQKNIFFRHLFEHTAAKELPEENKAYVYAGKGMAASVALLGKVRLNVANLDMVPFSEEENAIIRRFAYVFEQSYTRFMDLQRVEAQAREAQIEAALERVRARSMAMHESSDLQEVIKVVADQFNYLGINFDTVSFVKVLEDKSWDIWISTNERPYPAKVSIPYFKNKILDELNDHRAQGKTFYTGLYNHEEKNSFFRYFFENTNARNMPEERKQYVLGTQGYAISVFATKNISLNVARYEEIPFSGTENGILKRFALVFEQAYTRFMDLQKAEAQARESQIQLALERVRARTMAMHRSEELSETATVLFEQLKELGEEPERTAIGIVNEEERVLEVWATQHGGHQMNLLFKFTIDEPHVMQKVYRTWKEREKSIAIDLQGNELEEYYRFLKDSGVPVNHDAFTKRRVEHFAAFSKGMLCIITSEPRPPGAIALYERFASVFDLTYTRFLDLQKAETQARESQIELGLERVRARAMAMQSSDELKELIATVFTELTKLDLVLTRCVIMIYNGETNSSRWWMANSEDPGNPMEFFIKQHDHPPITAYFKAWREGKIKYTYELKGQIKKDWDDFLFSETELKNMPGFVIEGMKAPDLVYLNASFNNFGNLTLASLEPLSEEHFDILLRFAKVFDLTYTRFNDLQKAESQAREAQVEAALERVRSKTMAMHNSQEVGDTVVSLFDELIRLGVDNTIRCGVAIYINRSQIELWTAYVSKDGRITLNIGFIEPSLHPLLQGGVDAFINKQAEFTYQLEGADLVNYYKAISNAPNYTSQVNIAELPSKMAHYNFYFSEGSIFAFTREPLTSGAIQLFQRFTGVFGQTYRRYLDLQRAEAQAKEALIEAGLERVRARTMAMHSSDDVSTATATMFIELEKLGIDNIRGGITIIRPDQTQEVWGINNLPEGRAIRSIGVFDMRLHPLWQQIFKSKENNEDFGYYWLAGKDKENYIAILNSTPNYLKQPIKDFPDVHVQTYLFGEGGIWTNSLEPHTDEQKQIMKRFASVFSLTFRRYLDLQKAEAQAKEAQIEAGLERVRSKAMAMHNSQDLADTIGVFYKELKSFSITPRRCGVGLLDQEERIGELFTWNTTEQGESLELVGRLKMEGHPILVGVYDHWLTQTEYHPVLRGSEINEYYKVIRPQMSFPEYQHDQEQFGYFFFFKEGGVYAWTEKEMKEEELQIYRRFTSVLSLTYKRYKDLRQAEASAKEALRQASLDRVRAEIASMRTVEDLQRITPVIWNELTILNIPFIRCGIFIMDDAQQLAHTFLSTPDGKAIASFHLPYDTPGNIGTVISNWRRKEEYVEHWDEKEFDRFAEILVKQGAISSAAAYLKTIPKGGFYLHFLPFLQGMLYVANIERLNKDQVELIQHVADAFSTAYARYEDFNRLEAAKKQVENTLTDLKQAQQQLVQSEKMASLGELTAGIAHEIQNPLNFVNNFSDVSSELLDEMVDELSKGNVESAKEIVNDVKQNLEKINFHGKRADGIVKGMLQHSRTSSGQKEMSDINALADEYLRLAYHGLRAKDKSFNAKFETDFDDSIGKVSIIPQDIGRVILNLINNAFYAVNERKKITSSGYEPTVSITTKKGDDKVEIRVKDNGNGIPQRVLDKIFQPFFTTKPTGEGTGLGLSLSYDIVRKGHNGDLKVETKEGEGTEFIIQLPSN